MWSGMPCVPGWRRGRKRGPGAVLAAPAASAGRLAGGLAGAVSEGLGEVCQRGAERSGIGGAARVGPSGQALWRCRLAKADGAAARVGVDAASARPAAQTAGYRPLTAS